MKILLAAPQDGHSSLYLKKAFESLGHNLQHYDYRNTSEEPNGFLIKCTKAADLIVILKGEVFTPETLSQIHPCALLNFDLWYKDAEWLKAQAEAADHFFTPSKGVFPKGHYLPEAADLELHRPMQYQGDLASDVAFIGTVKDVPGRDEWLEEVGVWADEHGKTFKIWGSFPGEKSRKWHQGKRAGGNFAMGSDSEDVIHNMIVSSSKVILDRQRNPEIEGAISARVFRTMAAKGLVVMRQCKGQEELLGLRNGWNCMTYEKDYQCLDMIDAALSAEERYRESHILEAQSLRVTPHGVVNDRGIPVDQRAVLARHGYETVEARHQWVHRAKTILDTVKL